LIHTYFFSLTSFGIPLYKINMTSIFKEEVLKGKSALITGGATGINYEIARMFLLHGCKVCIVSRKQPNIDKAVAELKAAAPRAEIYGKTCDVRKQ
jgi:peroxisomal 2,4-dienoyl-CoA reductase